MPIRWVSRFFSPKPDLPLDLTPELTPELREEIRRSFDQSSRDEEHFPSTIDPRIYHVKLILDQLAGQGSTRALRILDVGCGKGRFTRIVKEHFPAADVWGLDISPEMLTFVPTGISTRAGSMTDLPFADAEFDCVYATESLEHAVAVERAVSEMCRVLKPGGSLIIIDKNAEHFGRLQTPAWEKWFHREELESLLRRRCRQVSSRFISYWEDVEPDGMFIAWTAVK